MGAPYTSQSATGYNSNPPADDGSQVEANRVKWSTIKTKLNDPVKTLADAINTAVGTAFGKVVGGAGVTSTAISYSVLATDQGKLVRASSGGITITTPSATDVASPFVFSVLNDSSSDITIDGSGTQTIDGSDTLTIPPDAGVMLYTDGTNWFTTGQNYSRTLIQPQGYLTVIPTATDPVNMIAATDQAAKTAVYYRPYRGNLIPIPDGTNATVREFAELTLTLNSNHVANGIYDVFVFSNSGTVTIGTGPVWNTVTAGSGARGTGAGTTQLNRIKGLLTNAVSMTARNGSTTYSVSAQSAVYVGSILIDATEGQVSCLPTYGQSRKWGVWNAYNRLPIKLQMGDATANWTYNSTTPRQSRATAGNTVAIFSGLAEEQAQIEFRQSVLGTASANNYPKIGIGVNSTSAVTGFTGHNAGNTAATEGTAHAEHVLAPAIGVNNINSLEYLAAGTPSTTFYGGNSDMLLTASFTA